MRPTLIVFGAFVLNAVCANANVLSAQTPSVKLTLARPDWTSSDAFSTVYGVRALTNGTVLVADGKEVEVKLLNSSGKIVRSIGRKGGGPGEYSSPDKLLPLRKDSTFILDVGSRRYLIVDPDGKVVETRSFPTAMGKNADQISAVDGEGRFYFSARMASVSDSQGTTAPIGRWKRGSDSYETVTTITLENPEVKPIPNLTPSMKDFVGQARMVFAASDDWAVSTSGRVALIHAKPYRVDWFEKNGKTTIGTPLAYKAIPVAEADRKLQEPNGPPYIRRYAEFKAPFMTETAIVDESDNVWIPRLEAANATTRRYDVFSSTGKPLITNSIPANRRLLLINRTHVYAAYTDGDGLRWLERYSR